MNVSSGGALYMSGEILTGILSIMTNGVVILAYNRTPSLHVVRNSFLINMAYVDLLAGVSIPPVSVLTLLGLPHHFYGCVLINSIITTMSGITIFNLLALSIDRFVAITWPGRYEQLLSKRGVHILVTIWVVATAVGLMPLLWNTEPDEEFTECSFVNVINTYYMVFVFILIVNGIPLFILVFLLSKTLQKIRQAIKLTIEQLPFDDQIENRQFKREVRTLAYIVLVYVVCWSPVDITIAVYYFIGKSKSISYPILGAFFVLSHIRSFVSPFLYAYGNIDLHQAVMKIVTCGKYNVSMDANQLHKYSLAMKQSTKDIVKIVTVDLADLNAQSIDASSNLVDIKVQCLEAYSDFAAVAAQSTDVSLNLVDSWAHSTDVSLNLPDSKAQSSDANSAPQTIGPPSVAPENASVPENPEKLADLKVQCTDASSAPQTPDLPSVAPESVSISKNPEKPTKK